MRNENAIRRELEFNNDITQLESDFKSAEDRVENLNSRTTIQTSSYYAPISQEQRFEHVRQLIKQCNDAMAKLVDKYQAVETRELMEHIEAQYEKLDQRLEKLIDRFDEQANYHNQHNRGANKVVCIEPW